MILNCGSVRNHVFFLLQLTSLKLQSSYPWGFIVVVDCGHTADVVSAGNVVDIANVVGTLDVIGRGGSNVGGPVVGTVAVQEAQREQAEVRLVAHIDEAQVGVGVIGLG